MPQEPQELLVLIQLLQLAQPITDSITPPKHAQSVLPEHITALEEQLLVHNAQTNNAVSLLLMVQLL